MDNNNNIIERMHDTVTLSSKDYGDKELDAFVYGIIVGWNGTDDDEDDPIISEGIKKEFLNKFGWTEDDWNIISTIQSCIAVMRREE